MNGAREEERIGRNPLLLDKKYGRQVRKLAFPPA